MSNTALIIFVKNPELGKVKTRLAKTVGDERALRIYKSLLAHTRKQCINVYCKRYLYYSNHVDTSDEWPPESFEKRLQSGKDLGERMINAFHQVLEEHERAIIIGSDCASLTSRIIQHAVDNLTNHDFAIGPAKDGGYYLLGLKRPLQETIFQNIAWSTDKVYSKTIELIRTVKANYTLLPLLSDIDTEADWNKYGWDL